MKCPLQFTLAYSEKNILSTLSGDCLQQECAWWHQENQGCAMRSIAQAGPYIHKALLDLVAKMPHERQFRELRR